MIKITKDNDNYLVSFIGQRHQFDDYITNVMDSEPTKYHVEKRSWEFDEEGIKRIREAFKVPEPPSVMPKESVRKVEASAYENIGKSMKLPPYDYQKEGIYEALEKGELLAVLPCGSGKTAIGIGAYLELKEQGKISGPGMIVVKASLKVQWHKEISKFSNLTSRVIDTSSVMTRREQGMIRRRRDNLLKAEKEGDTERVDKLQREILDITKQANDTIRSSFEGADLFVANYETLRDPKIRDGLKGAGIEFIMADEIHYIKNRSATRSKALVEFADVPYKLGATATPIGKNPEDLFGIFSFIAPDVFPKWSQFARKYIKYAGYGKVVGFKNIKDMRSKIQDNIFVKSKEEVSSQLPSLVVSQKVCSLTPAQERSHERIMEKLDELKDQEKAIRSKFKSEREAINNPELAKIEGLIMAHQTFAQQLSISEELLKMSESDMSSEFITKSPSEKIEMMLDLVEDIVSSEEKVAIFSRFKSIQDVIKPLIEKRIGAKVAQVYGELSSEERYEEAYDKFRDNDDYKVLLLSNAGAEGLNLSRCKYLIELEPAESYGVQTQRHGRVERSDSSHDTVFVYQLIAENSWDEIALRIISKKQEFDTTIIQKR